jgi:hypothetical protein
VPAALLAVRREISQLQAELATVKAALPSRYEIEQALDVEIARLAALAKPRIVFQGDGVRVQWPDALAHLGAAPPNSVTAMLAAMFPLELRALFSDQLKALPDGMSSREKARRLDELERDLLRLERDEEAPVEAAMAAGLEVDRRPTASPYAVLGLATQAHELAAAAEQQAANRAGEAIGSGGKRQAR